MVNVAIYLRLSDEDRDKRHKSDESESIQNQKSMLRAYCFERNWNIYDIYCDEDFSGADKSRPNFNRMLRDCEAGKVNVVLCKSQSRFSRDMEMVEKYIHNKFIEWGVRFIGVVDNADSANATNKKARQINGLINEWYLEDVSENIRETLKHKREKGEFTGSFAPYGYLIDPKNKNHLIVDENTAPIVKDIFNWYIQGWGYRKIVMELNDRHIPNPSSYKHQINSNYVNTKESESPSRGLWTHTTIYRMIRNETYCGTLVQGKSHNVSYKNKKRKPVSPNEWIKVENTHDAIIDKETWRKTQERLKSRARVNKSSYELSLFSFKVKCAVCGRAMKRNVYHNKSKTKTYYGLQCATYKTGAMNCTNTRTINGNVLESIVLEQLNNLLNKYCQSDNIILQETELSSIKSLEVSMQSYQNKIKALEDKILKIYDDKLEGIISLEQYIAYSKKYNDDIDYLKAECKNLNNKIKQYEENRNIHSKQKEIIKRYTHPDRLTREIVDEFIDCIYIGRLDENGNRDITINWKF